MKNGETETRVYMVVEPVHLSSFYPLLQMGVSVEAPTGISVKKFLCDELGLTTQYLDNVVQTVFLNGKAVDDLESAFIGKGSTLALSAAMPGLLGATLRRGSFYASMRKEISHQGRKESPPSGMERIRIKIFNLLLQELGRILLERGIWFPGEELQTLFRKVDKPFWAGCREATLNGRKIDPRSLREAPLGDKEVLLKVKPNSE